MGGLQPFLRLVKTTAALCSVAAAFGFLFAGCNLDDPGRLTIHGTGFGTTHVNGITVYGNVFNVDTQSKVAQASATLGGGFFTVDLGEVLENGVPYVANFFLDDDGNGVCNDPEHAEVAGPATGVLGATISIDVTDANHGLSDPVVCQSFL